MYELPARSISTAAPAVSPTAGVIARSTWPRAWNRRVRASDSPHGAHEARALVEVARLHAKGRPGIPLVGEVDRSQAGVVRAARYRVDAGIGPDGIGSERSGIAALVGAEPPGGAQRRARARAPGRRQRHHGGLVVVVGHGARRRVRRLAVPAVARGALDGRAPVNRSPRSRRAHRHATGAVGPRFQQAVDRRVPAHPGSHLDDAANGVGAEHGALRPPHHLDLVEAERGEMAEIEPAAEAVQLDAVDHHERVIGLAAARERRRHAAGASGRRHRHPRREPQRVGDHRELAILDVAPRHGRDARCRLRLGHFDERGRDDHRVGQRREGQANIRVQRLRRSQGDADGFRAETFDRRPEIVRPGRHIREDVRAVGAAGRLPQQARRRSEADNGPRHGPVGGVEHAPVNGRGLGEDGSRGRDEQQCEREEGEKA